MKTLILTLFAVLPILAQTTTTPPATTTTPAVVYPTYIISTGGGYTRNAASGQAGEGEVNADILVGGSTYGTLRINLFPSTSTATAGFKKIMSRSGNWAISAIAVAGVYTVTPVIANFQGGLGVGLDLKEFSSKLSGIWLGFEVDISADNTTTPAVPNQITPAFHLTLGKAYK